MSCRLAPYTANLAYPNQFDSPATNNLPPKKTRPKDALLLNWAVAYLIGE